MHDVVSLAAFVEGRLATVGLTEAWLAACACAAARGGDDVALARLDAECEARIASPALRAAGRALGRGLRRAAAVTWPAVAAARVQQQPLIVGVVAAAAGLAPSDAARLALHHALLQPLNAAPKVLSIDMADVMAVGALLAPLVDALVLDALDRAVSNRPPVVSAPLGDERSLRHASWEVRLFAS